MRYCGAEYTGEGRRIPLDQWGSVNLRALLDLKMDTREGPLVQTVELPRPYSTTKVVFDSPGMIDDGHFTPPFDMIVYNVHAAIWGYNEHKAPFRHIDMSSMDLVSLNRMMWHGPLLRRRGMVWHQKNWVYIHPLTEFYVNVVTQLEPFEGPEGNLRVSVYLEGIVGTGA